MNFFNMALDFIFPPICGICGEINKNYICTKCYKDIRRLEKCITNKYNNKYYSEHLYIFKYEGTIRKKIIEYKFEDKAYLYKTFSEIFIKNKTVCNYIKKYDVLIPVPISNKRKRKRGYNQSELICKELSTKLDVPICMNVVIKYKDNKSQSTLNKAERIKNVEDVYIIKNINKIKDKKVLLVDDIYTTGSTVNEIANNLIKSGAKDVGIITIAKD